MTFGNDVAGRGQFYLIGTPCDHLVAGLQPRQNLDAFPVARPGLHLLFPIPVLVDLYIYEKDALFFGQRFDRDGQRLFGRSRKQKYLYE